MDAGQLYVTKCEECLVLTCQALGLAKPLLLPEGNARQDDEVL